MIKFMMEERVQAFTLENVDWDTIGRVSGDNLDFDTDVIDADTFTEFSR